MIQKLPQENEFDFAHRCYELALALPDEKYSICKEELIEVFAPVPSLMYQAGVDFPDSRFTDVSKWVDDFLDTHTYIGDKGFIYNPPSALFAGLGWSDERFSSQQDHIVEELLMHPLFSAEAGQLWEDSRHEVFLDHLKNIIPDERWQPDGWSIFAYNAGILWSDKRFDELKEDYFFPDILLDPDYRSKALSDWQHQRSQDLVAYIEQEKKWELSSLLEWSPFRT